MAIERPQQGKEAHMSQATEWCGIRENPHRRTQPGMYILPWRVRA